MNNVRSGLVCRDVSQGTRRVGLLVRAVGKHRAETFRTDTSCEKGTSAKAAVLVRSYVVGQGGTKSRVVQPYGR